VKPVLRMRDPVWQAIADYTGNDAPDGYGAYNVSVVRDNDNPTNHADSFAWTAWEAFW
jgi:hypothetical protein